MKTQADFECKPKLRGNQDKDRALSGRKVLENLRLSTTPCVTWRRDHWRRSPGINSLSQLHVDDLAPATTSVSFNRRWTSADGGRRPGTQARPDRRCRPRSSAEPQHEGYSYRRAHRRTRLAPIRAPQAGQCTPRNKRRFARRQRTDQPRQPPRHRQGALLSDQSGRPGNGPSTSPLYFARRCHARGRGWRTLYRHGR